MNEMIEMIKRRRSIRKFEAESVPEDIVKDILDCARLAPTANNVQPWLFGAVTDPDLRKKVSELTDYGKFIPFCLSGIFYPFLPIPEVSAHISEIVNPACSVLMVS